MKKNYFTNLSILGLVLLVASAATTSIIPDKSNNKRANNGTLRPSDNEEELTCIFVTGGGVNSCTVSITNTTPIGGFESLVKIGTFYYQTIGNTSITADVVGDQNSMLEIVI
ncbi:hypothetical protein [Chitinophaga filiformis]|uniref:Uncharacterized protein n=1 Tax=Chitinophaga filiformis TaxID=104663 RepID=A0A1G7UMX4_CHIFI|nr:hypothetical protein [Chitinophaga filiformis]SDG48912.1 hypothetical protein SAMN04488121_104443 [Chitinophaga filiformis]